MPAGGTQCRPTTLRHALPFSLVMKKAYPALLVANHSRLQSTDLRLKRCTCEPPPSSSRRDGWPRSCARKKKADTNSVVEKRTKKMSSTNRRPAASRSVLQIRFAEGRGGVRPAGRNGVHGAAFLQAPVPTGGRAHSRAEEKSGH